MQNKSLKLGGGTVEQVSLNVEINLEKISASPKGIKAYIVTIKVKHKINLSNNENLNLFLNR